MVPLRGCLFAFAAAACLAAPAPISAALINYVFDEGTAGCFGPPTCSSDALRVTVTGSFTVDTGALAFPLPQVNITLTASPNGPLPGGPIATLMEGLRTSLSSIKADDGAGGTSVEINFAHSLADGTHDDLALPFGLVVIPSNPSNLPFDDSATDVTGAVSPISAPEPTSLALMGVALAIFFLGYQPKVSTGPTLNIRANDF
jgi:hypothetical protein